MCQCASCSVTDGYSDKGFAEWPKGEPAGKRASEAAYAAHVAFSCQWGKGKHPAIGKRAASSGTRREDPHAKYKFPPNGAELTSDAYIGQFLRSNNLAAEKQTPAEAGAARPEQPAKAAPHFPTVNRHGKAGEDSSSQSARIYAMPKSESKRPIGRPAMPGSRVVIKLPDDLKRKAEKLGGDNIAEGIREALRRVKVG